MRYYFRSTIDRPEREKWYLFLFLLIWLGVNLIQAAFTELIHDEAYYWMYSRNLAWGYFDHPPVIALLIKAGYSLFPNELGVRLFTALMGTLTLMFIYLLQDKEKRSLWLYILLTTSIVLVYSHVGGFLAIPDIPVVFFSAFFLLLYKKYLNQDSLVLAALLGIVAALMLYSKYHAVLVLGFTLLAYLKIVKRKTFWIIPLVIILVLMPHLFWQIHNGFPTFQYHLVGRSSSYQFDFTFNYLYSQLLIAGPLVAITVLYAAGSYRPQNTFDRILKINFLGVLLFFFLASFKGRVEAHWTAVAYIPLLVLAQKSCLGNPKCLMWLQRLYLPGICLFIFLRIALIVQIFPPKLKLGQELHNWDQWAKQVDSVAGGRMVVFASTFQRPAKYSFYTKGKFAHSLNSVHYRKNQYDIWPFEDSIQHQRVMLIQGVAPKQTMYTVVGEKYGYEFIDDFVSYQDLQIDVSATEYTLKSGDSLTIPIILRNTRPDSIEFREGDNIVLTFFRQEHHYQTRYAVDLKGTILSSGEQKDFLLHVPVSFDAGKYSLYISVCPGYIQPPFNSKRITVQVSKGE